MSFLSPYRLYLLIAVAALVLAYLAMQSRRRSYALRFASSELFDAIAPEQPRFRRHVPATIFLAGLAVLVAAFAQPATQVRVPRERATIVIAIDVSLSMMAEDIDPDRLQAAQQAAHRFVDELPPTLNVGLVSFAGTASTLVSPTLDRLAVHQAIDALQLAESTAIGEAIFTSLGALAVLPDEPGGTEPPPARVVLLSDGETTIGRPDEDAIAAAIEANVNVSTIAFGTPYGFIVYDDPATDVVDPTEIPVPVQEENLQVIADETGGTFFTASSLAELDKVYDDIGSAIGYETVDREVTDWAVGLGLLLMTVAAAFSLLWFQRLP